MISCININKKSMRKSYLSDINLKFEKGFIYGLVGPNGSGKSNLLKLIAGLQRPTAGEIKIEGQSIGCKTKALVSFMPSEMLFYHWMTLSHCIHFYKSFYPDFIMERCLHYMTLFELEPSMKISQLSNGQIMRLKIVLTFARDAKIFLLDEPFSSLDPLSKETCIKWMMDLCGSERLFIIATHDIEDLEPLIDRLVVMKEGSVLMQGDLEQLNLTRLYSLGDYYKEVLK